MPQSSSNLFGNDWGYIRGAIAFFWPQIPGSPTVSTTLSMGIWHEWEETDLWEWHTATKKTSFESKIIRTHEKWGIRHCQVREDYKIWVMWRPWGHPFIHIHGLIIFGVLLRQFSFGKLIHCDFSHFSEPCSTTAGYTENETSQQISAYVKVEINNRGEISWWS